MEDSNRNLLTRPPDRNGNRQNLGLIRGRRMRFSRVLIGMVVLCSAASAFPRESVYQNKQYGIFLHIPSAAWLCPQGGGSDHGPFLLLGSKDASRCRSDLRQNRWISIFGQYSDGETLHTFLNRLCADTPPPGNDFEEVTNSAPTDLGVGGLPSNTARINHSNGAIEIIVVTQAGKPNPEFEASVPSFEYSFSLNTDTRHLDSDLAVFRAVLKAVRLAPVSPQDAHPGR